MNLVAVVALAVASATVVPHHAEADEKKFLHLPVSRRNLPDPENLELFDTLYRRASNDVDVSLSNNQSFYAIDFELGTPPQPLSLLLDTGSSDVWVFDYSACNSPSTQCPQASIFNSQKSSTFKNNHTRFLQQYADTSTAMGEWAQDTMILGGANITNFNFAVAEQSNSTQGTAGIGLSVGETPFMLGDIKAPYLNLPQQLKQQGTIQRVAYSLWLNRFGAEAGSVLFGAVDHAKYSSDLYTMPLVATEGLPIVTRFAVQMTGLSVYDASGNEQPFASCNAPIVLDSGSTISSMPFELISPFYDAIGAEQYESLYLIDCDSLSSKNGGLGIQVGGIDITVGFSDLFVPYARERIGGTTYCIPGFLVSEGLPILGDNILRTLYVVYDLESLEVGLAAAQTGSAASSSSIEVLSTGIPGTRALNHSTASVGSDYASTSITLLNSGGSKISSMASISTPGFNSLPESSGQAITSGLGFGGQSMTVPSSVTQSILIGAKTAIGKGNNAQPTRSSSHNNNNKGSKSKNHAAVASASSLLTALAGVILTLL